MKENQRWSWSEEKIGDGRKKDIILWRNGQKEMMEYFGNEVGDKEFGNLEERKKGKNWGNFNIKALCGTRSAPPLQQPLLYRLGYF